VFLVTQGLNVGIFISEGNWTMLECTSVHAPLLGGKYSTVL
jgi:hypothetical protein